MNCETLNITMGTDVVLRDTLIFDGETFDPALSVGITANLVSSLGKRTALEVEVADGGLIIYVPWVDGRNAGFYGLEVTGSCNSKKWATYADSLIHYTRATEMGVAEVTIDSDYYDITQEVGFMYSTSPIKSVTASVDAEVGTPSVEYQYDGKNINFDFHNLKGNTGEQGIQGVQGIPGESAVFDPTTGNIAVIKQGTGDDVNSPMSQAAVTGEFVARDAVLGDIKNVSSALESPTWERGGINMEDGSDVTATVTIRSGFFRSGYDRIHIACATGYFIKSVLAEYSATKSDVAKTIYYGNSGSGFDTTKTTIDFYGEGLYFRCTVGKVNGGTITGADGANISFSAVAKVPSGMSEPVTFAEVAARASMVKMQHTATFDGYIHCIRGDMEANTSFHTLHYRKYEIEDDSRNYYADLRVAASEDNKCGVAYYDASSNFICGQFDDDGLNTTRTFNKTRLLVPKGTKYIYVLGADNDKTAGYILPQLYMDDEIQNESNGKVSGTHLKEVARVSIVGEGTTAVKTPKLYLTPNTRYVAKVSYESWTLPSPSTTTAAFVFAEYVGGNVFNTGYRQNEFVEFSEMDFITRVAHTYGQFTVRAAAGEVINIVIYQYEDIATIGSAKLPGVPTQNTILYNVSKVNTTAMEDTSSASYVEAELVDSSWAVVFPSTYTPTGTPTQVIAMLHGASGYVTPSVMGYNTDKWKNWRNLYLQRGYAVMEINGWGISTSSDHKSQHWGCPAALETIDKAFDTLRQNYNVEQKIMLHGSSMGGAAAWAYSLSHPNKVAALGLFSPATLSWIMLLNRNISDYYLTAIEDWQYADAAAAIADDYRRIVGYDPIIRALRYKDGAYMPPAQLAGLDVLQYSSSEYTLVGQALPFPVRIWHGTDDVNVPISLSSIIAEAYRRGGQLVTLRTCPGETHAICTGGTQYVCDEALDFFDTYKL